MTVGISSFQPEASDEHLSEQLAQAQDWRQKTALPQEAGVYGLGLLLLTLRLASAEYTQSESGGNKKYRAPRLDVRNLWVLYPKNEGHRRCLQYVQ